MTNLGFLIFVAWWAVLILVWALCRTAALNDREELPRGMDASDREAGGPSVGSSVSSAPMVPYDRLRLVDDDFHPLLDLTKNATPDKDSGAA